MDESVQDEEIDEEIEMQVELISYTHDADDLCGLAGKVCTSEYVPELGGDYTRTLKGALKSGHESIIEHASYTFVIKGISRVTLAQLTRHRIASYSVQSQRYVDCVPLVSMPQTIMDAFDEDNDLKSKFVQAMSDMMEVYDSLTDKHIPHEDIRYLYLQGSQCNLIVTMNARELLHFFELRCCKRAQWEINGLASNMLDLCKKVSPNIFADAGAPCTHGKCREKVPCKEGKKDE